MSALPPKSPATLAPFSDAFGFRVLGFDKKSGDRLEMLRLRPQLASSAIFEAALRERQRALAEFRHPAFARVRQVDRPAGQPAALAIVSNHAEGHRLSDLLRNAETHQARVDLVAAMCLLRQMVAGVAHLHEQGEGVSHGALTPERFVVTPNGRVMLTEYVLGAGLTALNLTPQQSWQDYRVPVPAGDSAVFDQRTDILQLGYLGLTLVYGRSIYDRSYPPAFAERIERAEEIQLEGRPQALHSSIATWLTRALLGGDRAFTTALDAQTALDEAIASAGLVATPDVIVDLVKRAEGQPAEPSSDVEPSSAVAPPLYASAPLPTPDQDVPVPAVREPLPAPQSAGGGSWSLRENEPLPSMPVQSTFAAPEPEEPEIGSDSHTTEPMAAVSAPPVETPLAAEPEAAETPQEPAAPDLAPARAWTPPTASERSLRAERAKAEAAARVEASTKTAEPAMFGRYGDAAPSHAETASDAPARKVGRPYLIALGMAVVMVVGFEVVLRFFNPFAVAPSKAISPSELGGTHGTLSIDSTPQARVLIDDEAKGTTPVRLELTPGVHRVRLEAEGYGRSFQVNVIADKEVSQVVELSRTQDTGTIDVKSEPVGARVTLDGKPVGVSPITLTDVKPGAHAIVVEGPNGSSARQVVQVVAGATAAILVPLTAALPVSVPAAGWITVESSEELQVFEGGKLLGSTRTERIMLPAGAHDIELRNDAAGFTTTRMVQVPPGKVAHVSVQLPDGSLSLNAVPWAEVWLDGQRIGETPVGNVAVRAGSHELIFRHPQHGEIRQTVVVKAGEIGRVTVNMAK
jgi:serine/threonine protein kinase